MFNIWVARVEALKLATRADAGVTGALGNLFHGRPSVCCHFMVPNNKALIWWRIYLTHFEAHWSLLLFDAMPCWTIHTSLLQICLMAKSSSGTPTLPVFSGHTHSRPVIYHTPTCPVFSWFDHPTSILQVHPLVPCSPAAPIRPARKALSRAINPPHGHFI